MLATVSRVSSRWSGRVDQAWGTARREWRTHPSVSVGKHESDLRRDKVLETANIKLASAVTTVLGVSELAMLKALITERLGRLRLRRQPDEMRRLRLSPPSSFREIFRDGPANAYFHSANRLFPLSRPSARVGIAAARPKIPV